MYTQKYTIAVLVAVISQTFAQTQQDCQAEWLYRPPLFSGRSAPQNSTVCRCDESYCDNFVVKMPVNQDDVLIVRSSKTVVSDSEVQPARFAQSTATLVSSKPSPTFHANYTVSSEKLQDIWGFGGALTDATALLVKGASSKLQDMILESYFSEETGNGYTTIRTNMGGCDFSVRTYTYLDTAGDYELSTFELAPEDMEYKIPMFKQIQEIAGNRVKIFAAPWTAPSWMKTNGEPAGNGQIIPEDKYYQTWADYFVRYIQAYEEQGIQFSQVSLQNEPGVGSKGSGWKWQQTFWNATGQNMFLKKYLLPAFEQAGIDITVQLFDGNRLEFVQSSWPIEELSGLSGSTNGGKFQIAMHWYENFLEIVGRGKDQKAVYTQLKDTFGDNFSMLGTEACMPLQSYPSHNATYRQASDDLGNWMHGVYYSQDIIVNLNRYYAGWTDWNMVLDMTGGPNWAGNRHDAPIIIDNENGVFYKNPMFYHMGHFSKFLDDSYTVMESGNTIPLINPNSPKFHFVAARNDDYEVYVVLNKGSEEYNNWYTTSSGKYLNHVTPPFTIETIVIKL